MSQMKRKCNDCKEYRQMLGGRYLVRKGRKVFVCKQCVKKEQDNGISSIQSSN